MLESLIKTHLLNTLNNGEYYGGYISTVFAGEVKYFSAGSLCVFKENNSIQYITPGTDITHLIN